MKQTALVGDTQIEKTLNAINGNTFTIIDFVRTFSDLYPEDWSRLVVAYGQKGDGLRRNYTAATYLGNRLWQLTKKAGSPLLPLVRWTKGGVETPSQRQSTPQERAMGAEAIIRVFRTRASE